MTPGMMNPQRRLRDRRGMEAAGKGLSEPPCLGSIREGFFIDRSVAAPVTWVRPYLLPFGLTTGVPFRPMSAEPLAVMPVGRVSDRTSSSAPPSKPQPQPPDRIRRVEREPDRRLEDEVDPLELVDPELVLVAAEARLDVPAGEQDVEEFVRVDQPAVERVHRAVLGATVSLSLRRAPPGLTLWWTTTTAGLPACSSRDPASHASWALPTVPRRSGSCVSSESSRNQFARSDGTTETSRSGRSLPASKFEDLGTWDRKLVRSSWLPRVR